MNDLERQVRDYANALVEDSMTNSSPLAEVAPRASRPQRIAFMAVAACLVIAAGVVGVLALAGPGGDSDRSASASAAAGGLELDLWLSTTTPAPDEEVTARVTFTNISEAPIEVPDGAPYANAVCRTRITLLVDEAFEVQLDTGSADLDRSLAWQASWATFPNTPLPEPMTATEFDALTAAQFDGSSANRGEELAEQRYPCEPTEVVLAPGESTSITKSLVAGAIGLPPGPGAVSTFTSVDGQPLEVAVPVEIPAAPSGVITRAEAIELAVNDPEVSALLSRLPPQEPPGITEGTAVPSHSGLDDPATTLSEPPAPEPQEPSGVVLEATSQGWSLAYARADGTFVATVDPAGAVTVDLRP